MKTFSLNFSLHFALLISTLLTLSSEASRNFVKKESSIPITITTLTDLVAFAIGAFSKVYFVKCVNCAISFFTCLHCRNFCLFAILSLSFVYLYICTFFLAALAIDQRRIDAGRWVEIILVTMHFFIS